MRDFFENKSLSHIPCSRTTESISSSKTIFVVKDYIEIENNAVTYLQCLLHVDEDDIWIYRLIQQLNELFFFNKSLGIMNFLILFLL